MVGRLVFKNGWQQFVKEKNLEEGDFLVFQYDGKSTFKVKIFSKTGCRKVATPPTREKTVPIVNLEEDSDEPSHKIQSNATRKRSLPIPKLNVRSVLEGQWLKYSFCIISYHCYPKAKHSPTCLTLIGACSWEGALRKSKRLMEEKDKQNDKKPASTKHIPLQNPHFQVLFDSSWRLRNVVSYFIL